MDGHVCPEGLSQEQFEQAQRLFEVTEAAGREERWRMCCLLASKKDSELFGETEFQLRDQVHRLGARVLEAAAGERKKGGTKDAVLLASAGTQRSLSSRGRGRS